MAKWDYIESALEPLYSLGDEVYVEYDHYTEDEYSSSSFKINVKINNSKSWTEYYKIFNLKEKEELLKDITDWVNEITN